MKKTTINNILLAAIALMSVSICVLIFCIATRPRYVTVSEPETAVITEVPNISDVSLESSTSDSSLEKASAAAAGVSDEMHGKTSTKVNIRDAASADAKVLDTVEGGTTFDILEILDNGWTKILYNDSEAYISSDYVIVVNE